MTKRKPYMYGRGQAVRHHDALAPGTICCWVSGREGSAFAAHLAVVMENGVAETIVRTGYTMGSEAEAWAACVEAGWAEADILAQEPAVAPPDHSMEALEASVHGRTLEELGAELARLLDDGADELRMLYARLTGDDGPGGAVPYHLAHTLVVQRHQYRLGVEFPGANEDDPYS